jgi:hypothetical protein
VALAVHLVLEDVGAVLLEDDALGPAGDGGLRRHVKLRRGRIGGLRERRCNAYDDFPGDVCGPQVLPVAADAGVKIIGLFNYNINQFLKFSMSKLFKFDRIDTKKHQDL